MRYFQLALLCVAAGLALVAVSVSAYMNWIWGYTLSAIPAYQVITGSIALMFDLVKAFLPLIAVVAVSAGLAFSHGAKNMFFVLLSAGSVWAAFLFLTSNRMDSFAVKANAVQNRKEVKNDIEIKQAELKAVGRHRPFVVVDADYKARCYTDKRQRWRSCKNLLKERGRALAALDLKKEIKDLKAEKKTIAVVGAQNGGLGVVSQETGVSVAKLSTGQALVTAVMLEILTGYIPSIVFATLFKLLALMKKEKEARLVLASSSSSSALQGQDVSQQDVNQGGDDDKDKGWQQVGQTSFVQSVLSPAMEAEAKAARLTNSALDYFTDRLVVREGVHPLSSILVHQDYRAWCADKNFEELSYVEFTRQLSDYLVQILGVQAVDKQGNNATMGVQCLYRGIDVKQEKGEKREIESTIVPIKSA